MKTADISTALTGAQLLLSMVETRRAARNGRGGETAHPRNWRISSSNWENWSPWKARATTSAKKSTIYDFECTRCELKWLIGKLGSRLNLHAIRSGRIARLRKRIFTDFSEIHGDRAFC